MFVYVMTSFR